MNVGSKEIFEQTQENLPYDKELQWIAGAEGIYCPLNVTLAQDVGFKIEVERIKDDTSDVTAFGSRDYSKGSDTRWFVGGWQNGSNKQWYFGYGVRHDYNGMKINEVVSLELNYLNSRKARFNGTDVASLASSSGSEGLQLHFPAYSANTGINTSYCTFYRYYSFKLSKGTEILFDLIPVRVGNVGHFYDKISKQILPEAGSAKFIVGPDRA